MTEACKYFTKSTLCYIAALNLCSHIRTVSLHPANLGTLFLNPFTIFSEFPNQELWEKDTKFEGYLKN